MLIKATDSGGITTMVFAFSVIILIITLVGAHMYENIYEERSSLPYVLVPKEVNIASTITVTITLRESGFTAADSLDACDNSRAELRGITTTTEAIPTLTCSVEGTHMTAKWVCPQCTLGFETPGVRFVFSDARALAVAVTSKIQSTSGVESEVSTTETTAYVTNNDTVLRGVNVPTVFTADAFPLLFGWKEDVDQGNNATTTGYLVSFTSAKVGETASLSQLDYTHGLVVDIKFNVLGESTLMVTRRRRTTDVDFLSALLGAVSGISGVCIALMKLYEGFTLKRHERGRLKIVNKAQADIASIAPAIRQAGFLALTEAEQDDGDKYGSMPEWWESVAALMGAGMTYSMARATVRCCMQSVAPRGPTVVIDSEINTAEDPCTETLREKDMKRNGKDTANDEVTFEGKRPTTTTKTEPTHAELEKEEEMKEALEAYRRAGAFLNKPPRYHVLDMGEVDWK